MGTRADFYVRRGEQAEWLGSIAWDGYPRGITEAVKTAATETEYRAAIQAFFDGRDNGHGSDVTLPEQGWPWPWEDSGTTDYAYAFDNNGEGGSDQVWFSRFGRPWRSALEPEPDDEDEDDVPGKVSFPNMKDRQNIRWDRGSGLIVISR